MGESAARTQASHSRDDWPAVDRRIWLVADDYGISRAVNAAIRDLMARGSINATSVMVVASGFDDEEAAKLNVSRGDGAIGLHLTLTAPFRPLNPGYGPTHDGVWLSLGETFVASMLRRLNAQALTEEIAAQIVIAQQFSDVAPGGFGEMRPGNVGDDLVAFGAPGERWCGNADQ